MVGHKNELISHLSKAEYGDVLMNTEVRWLSRREFLELVRGEEIAIFVFTILRTVFIKKILNITI